MDFVAVDVETANPDFSSICSVGLVVFRAGVIVASYSVLINPESDFDPINVSIHGISADHVAGRPNFREAYPFIAKAFANSVVVHHSHFDRVALCRAAAKYGFDALECSWLDTARVARRAWERYRDSGYGLAGLAADFGLEFKHHDATEDARVAGLLLLRALAETGLGLDEWIIRAQAPISSEAGGRISRIGSPDGPLAGEVVVFTGALAIPRRSAADCAASAGCDVTDRVTEKTTMLVVGDQDIQRLSGHEKSAKHRAAEKLIQRGAQIRVVGESDFKALVGI